MRNVQKFMELIKKYKWAAAIAVLLVLGLIVYGVMSWHNGIMNTGREKQRDLVTLNRGIETSLSNCLDSGATAAKVVLQQNTSLKDLYVKTAAARYENDSAANEAIRGGSMFSAIRESYPTIDQKTWNDLLTLVVACRKDVKDAQDRLQHDAGEFDKWRTTGGVIERTVRNNFPNDELTATDQKGNVLIGDAALKYLTKVISIADAKSAMDTGKMPEQDLFGKPTTAPVPTASPTR